MESSNLSNAHDIADWSPCNADLPPLSGLKVARLGASRAGNYLARILSDQGATIVQAKTASDAAGARVVLNDLGRGAAAPAGLDYDALAKFNPRLVYCSLVSFPANGPKGCVELEDEPVMAALGFNRYASDAPKREPLPVPSFFGAVFGAIYITCALRPHINQMGPQHIEVPLYAAALNVLGRATVIVDDPKYGDVPPGTPHVHIADIYRCADGRYLQPHATYPHFAKIICEVGGHPEWGDAAAAGLRRVKDKETEAMWRKRFVDMWAQKPALDWENELEARKGSGTIARTHAEWMAEPHARAAKIFVQDAANGSWRLGPGSMLKANPHDGAKSKAAPAPDLSQTGPHGKPLPLAGTRIADFCIIIAGPTVGRVLADLGADVIKIEAPNRELSPYLWFDVNRGKRSIVLDLKKPGAADVARRIIARADVVSENFRSGKFAAFGFGYEALVKERPELICASTNALDYDGPWETRPGWEHNAQAGSGQQMARAENGVAQQVPFPVNDYATGLFGALGVVLGILRRDLTGVGSRARASLVRSGTWLQLISYEPDLDAPSKLRPAQVLTCSDGYVSAWLSTNATAAQEQALAQAASHASSQTCEAIVESLTGAGVSAMWERKPKEMIREKWVEDAGLAVSWTHPVYGHMRQATPRAETTRFEATPGKPAPAPASQTRDILREIGLEADADKLIASGAVHDKLSLFA